jgi:hypothetical protein
MLEEDLTKRISIFDVQNHFYLCRDDVPRLDTDEIRQMMHQRLQVDETLQNMEENLEKIPGVPLYIPFSWNCPIIRHTF